MSRNTNPYEHGLSENPTRYVKSLIDWWKRDWAYVVIVSLIAIIILMGIAIGWNRRFNSDDVTLLQLRNLTQTVAFYHKKTRKSTPSIQDLVNEGYFAKGSLPKDRWGNDFALVYLHYSDHSWFAVHSKGLDGRLGSEDDVFSPWIAVDSLK